MNDDQTIVAIATAAGPSARMIVRTSGPRAFELAALLVEGDLAAGRASEVRVALPQLATDGGACATQPPMAGHLRFGATCYCFGAPRSHTGQDVVEYHIPGNPLLARMLVEALVRLGARQAQPGEFSARAFFNGKLRLDEAEGVAAVISAGNDRELSAARRLRAGELARRLEPLMDELADLVALCELGIDFSEEDVVVLEAGEARRRIEALSASLLRLTEQSPKLEELGRPPRIALAGRPNAGKSTLLNALAGYRRAVSSEQPGTTRDALTAEAEVAGGRVTIVDLAGTGTPADALDAAAHRRAQQETLTADLLVLVRDVTDARPDPPLARAADLVVKTKIDLLAGKALPPEIGVSGVTGEGMEALRTRLGDLAFGRHGGGEALALSARHREQIAASLEALDEAAGLLADSYEPELVALHLREALGALGAIVGMVTPDELLGRIFSRFCIGK